MKSLKEKMDLASWNFFVWVQKNSKKIAVFLVFVGVMLISVSAFAQSGVEQEISNFAETLRNILVGPVAKTLAVGCFIGAGACFMLGKFGIAVACIVGGIFLGFAEKIAEAVFR